MPPSPDPEVTAKAKRKAVLRLLRGEELDALSRELKVTAAKLSEWRDVFLAGGESSLKARERDARDEEITRLKDSNFDRVGVSTMLAEGRRR